MANETAKVVRFHTLGGPEVLKIQEEPIPEPGKGEVRLNVKAIGLNRAEVMFRKGEYLESGVLPSKLGYEAAGVVAAVGPDVDKSWLGKKASTVPAFLAKLSLPYSNYLGWILKRRETGSNSKKSPVFETKSQALIGPVATQGGSRPRRSSSPGSYSRVSRESPEYS